MVVRTVARHEVHDGCHRGEDPAIHVATVKVGFGEAHGQEGVLLARVGRPEKVERVKVV